MTLDSHANFAYSTVRTPPSPAATGLTVTIQNGDGVKFPLAPCSVIVCPADTAPTVGNAEIVRYSAIAGDTFTIARKQENTNPRTIQAGDQFFVGPTAKTYTDIENDPRGKSPIGAGVIYYGTADPVDSDGITRWYIANGRANVVDTASHPAFAAWAASNGLVVAGGFVTLPDLSQKVPVGAGGAHALHTSGGVETYRLLAAESGTNGNAATGNDTPDHGHQVIGTTATDYPDHAHGFTDLGGYGRTDFMVGAGGQWVAVQGWGQALWYVGSGTAGANARHQHDMNFGSQGASSRHAHWLSARDADAAHTNMQPFHVVNFVIRTL